MPAQFARTTRSLAKDSAAGAILVWGIAALALAAWCGWMFFGRVAVYEVSTKARLEVQEAAHPVSGGSPPTSQTRHHPVPDSCFVAEGLHITPVCPSRRNSIE